MYRLFPRKILSLTPLILSTFLPLVAFGDALGEDARVSPITGMALDNFYGACLNDGCSLSVSVPLIENLERDGFR